MSDDAIHTETYTHASGKKYIVEVHVDYDFSAPETEFPDCHGAVVELEFDPSDEGDVEDYITRETAEDSIQELEERARMSMMRVLGKYSYRWAGQRKYYDVWESLKKAKEVWGLTDEAKAREAVEKDFTYIDGWYDDDWHWCTVFVYAINEHWEKTDDYHCIGGYESTIIEAEHRESFVEIIEDCIHQVEHDIRQQLHKDQLELDLRVTP